MHGPPLQAGVVAANRAVLATFRGDPGAHDNEQGTGKCKTERGKNDEGSRHGMAWQRWLQANTACRTRPLQANTAGRRSDRHRPCSKQQPADEVGRPLAMQCRLVEGVRWCWPLRRRARTYLTVSLPPIAFACLRPYPLP